MCEPTTLTLLTVASGAMSYVGQVESARAQEAANQRSTALIMQNQQLQIQALKNAEQEDRVATSQAIIDTQRAADAARSTAAVAAGEAGVAGLSVDALLGDLTMQESQSIAIQRANQSFRQRQRQLDREGTGITSRSQVNQLPMPQYPDLFGSALSTAIDGIGTYRSASMYDRLNQ